MGSRLRAIAADLGREKGRRPGPGVDELGPVAPGFMGMWTFG